eukprot:1989275-Rhodomonas_salina.1
MPEGNANVPGYGPTANCSRVPSVKTGYPDQGTRVPGTRVPGNTPRIYSSHVSDLQCVPRCTLQHPSTNEKQYLGTAVPHAKAMTSDSRTRMCRQRPHGEHAPVMQKLENTMLQTQKHAASDSTETSFQPRPPKLAFSQSLNCRHKQRSLQLLAAATMLILVPGY